MKISDSKKKRILMLREEGLSYDKIAKEVKVSRTSVINIIKFEETILPKPRQAWVYKICPNPRVILIHFGDKAKWAKCVVKAGIFNTPGKPLQVKKVETTDEELYRQI
jgi:DNA-binding XRE family transcriptional regulator